MSRILYTVSCRCPDEDAAARWIAWLRGGHAADVMKGGAVSAEIAKLDPDGQPGAACQVRYIFPSRALFDAYIRDHAPRLRAEGLALFPPERGFVYGRSVGEIAE